MRALLDVNVLIAVVDSAHEHHFVAAAWFANNASAGWASTAITQNGLIRIVGHPGYKNSQSASDLIDRLQAMTANSHHQQWPEDVSIADGSLFDKAKIHDPKQVTDIYLLGLAVKHGGRLVTFDGSIATNAVVGFHPVNLVALLAP